MAAAPNQTTTAAGVLCDLVHRLQGRKLGAKVESLQKLFTRKVVFSKASLAFEQDRSIKIT